MAVEKPTTVPTLAELIAQQRGRRSNADLEQESGGTPKAQRWQHFATPTEARSPIPPNTDPEQIKTIARVLGVTVDMVWISMGRSIGLEVGRPKSSFENLLPANTDELDEDDVEFHLLSLRRDIDFRIALKGKAGRKPTNSSSVTPLRAARTSSGNEYRGKRP